LKEKDFATLHRRVALLQQRCAEGATADIPSRAPISRHLLPTLAEASTGVRLINFFSLVGVAECLAIQVLFRQADCPVSQRSENEQWRAGMISDGKFDSAFRVCEVSQCGWSNASSLASQIPGWRDVASHDNHHQSVLTTADAWLCIDGNALRGRSKR
jgi:hypothetical protein